MPVAFHQGTERESDAESLPELDVPTELAGISKKASQGLQRGLESEKAKAKLREWQPVQKLGMYRQSAHRCGKNIEMVEKREECGRQIARIVEAVEEVDGNAKASEIAAVKKQLEHAVLRVQNESADAAAKRAAAQPWLEVDHVVERYE